MVCVCGQRVWWQGARQLVWWEAEARASLVTVASALSFQHCVCVADHLSSALRGGTQHARATNKALLQNEVIPMWL